MLRRTIAVTLLALAARAAHADPFPEFPTRFYASTATSIVLATPAADAHSFTVTRILAGNQLKIGDTITPDPGLYSLAHRFEGQPSIHPTAALLFLEKSPDNTPRIALGGIRLLTADQQVLTTRQESDPGPYTFVPLADTTWDQLLTTTKNIAALAAEVRAIAALRPDAARNKAALAWIAAHQSSFTGKIFADPTERRAADPAPATKPAATPGFAHVEWDAFAILQHAPIPQDAWHAITAWIALTPNDTGPIPGESDSIAFGIPQGRALLANAAADSSLSPRTRLTALRLLRVALVPNAVGQKRPTDAELESIEASLITALRADDPAVITACATMLATFHEHFQFGGPDPRVIEALTQARDKAPSPDLKSTLTATLQSLK